MKACNAELQFSRLEYIGKPWGLKPIYVYTCLACSAEYKGKERLWFVTLFCNGVKI